MSTNRDEAIANAALAYFSAHRSRDVEEIRKVFNADAEIYQAKRLVARGIDDIVRLYANVFKHAEDGPHPGQVFVKGNQAACELEMTAGGVTNGIADFFVIQDGRIQRLTAYLNQSSLPEAIRG